jgi:methyltransferase-like protein/2-polyprenyl-3-methyl-5-hydroxy-6-metoxy-1,4-benzoquinol methylase
MSSELLTSYDETPYPAVPYSQTHPDRLATIGVLFGMEPTPVEACRVLELGCADGSNLIPMAVQLPGSRFVGVDLSSRQVEQGQQLVDALGLDNVELRHQNILDVGEELGTFDYIIAHGVFSWVPDAAQERILAICAAQLAPSGIAYVSYNTYPGWHLRGLLRDMMLFHTRKFAKSQDQIQQARALIQFLADAVPTEENPYGMLLQKELEHMRGWQDSYFRHDSLSEFNDPLYFYEFVERAERHGLRYLGEAEFHTMIGRNLAPKVFETLDRIGRNLVEMEQYMDFVRNRLFRQTLLCRRDVRLRRRVSPNQIERLRVVAPLAPDSPHADLQSPGPEPFRGKRGTLTLHKPLEKAAFSALAAAWPQSVAFDELVADAYRRVEGHDVVIAAGAHASNERQGLADTLLVCYSKNLIELHVSPGPFVVRPGPSPVATPLARHQAAAGVLVTNQRHEPLRLADLDRRVLQMLDGSRDRARLLEELRTAAERSELTVRKAGKPIDAPAELASVLAEQLDASLARLARSALLIA